MVSSSSSGSHWTRHTDWLKSKAIDSQFIRSQSTGLSRIGEGK